jgi:hypothetical protein
LHQQPADASEPQEQRGGGSFQATDRAAARVEGQAFDEDYAMSAMAGRAAWAQDPRSGQQQHQQQQHAVADVDAALQRAPDGPLLDTPSCELTCCGALVQAFGMHCEDCDCLVPAAVSPCCIMLT